MTWHDYENANLMTMLAYILVGSRDWEDAEIRIFAAVPQEEASERRVQLNEMIDSGRLPISRKNLRIIPTDEEVDFAVEQLVTTVRRLRELSPLYEMVLEGIDLSSVK